MIHHRTGRPPLPTPLIINRMRLRGRVAGAIMTCGDDAPEVAKLMLARYVEVMENAPIRFSATSAAELDRLLRPVPQRATDPYGRPVDLAPLVPLTRSLYDAWYDVASRGREACLTLIAHFGGSLDVTGLSRPTDLYGWAKLLHGLLVARNHPEYASDPVAAYRAAGLCA